MSKLLTIIGQTATGKTTVALNLAKKTNGDVISADSRQVYQEMNVITGKDVPLGSKFKVSNLVWNGRKIGYWETSNGVRIWLADLIAPTEKFSAADFAEAAWEVIKFLWKDNKLPILTGGTGLYIKAVIDGLETMGIPPNRQLRERLSYKSTEELYDMLGQLDSVKAAQMNTSDRKNPRRLIRAIEIADWKRQHKKELRKNKRGAKDLDILMIGLVAPEEALRVKINQRVEERVRKGALEEIEGLLLSGVTWEDQSMSGLGYRQLKAIFENKKSLENAISDWEREELKYAKRQLTWFKKDRRVNWFDISKEGWRDKLEAFVEKWYDKDKHA